MTVINSVNVKDVPTQARGLLAQPGKWTRGAFARDEDGKECAVYDDAACSFCAAGALRVAAIKLGCPSLYVPTMTRLQDAIARITKGDEAFIARANDKAKDANEVLVYFDDAIAHCP